MKTGTVVQLAAKCLPTERCLCRCSALIFPSWWDGLSGSLTLGLNQGDPGCWGDRLVNSGVGAVRGFSRCPFSEEERLCFCSTVMLIRGKFLITCIGVVSSCVLYFPHSSGKRDWKQSITEKQVCQQRCCASRNKNISLIARRVKRKMKALSQQWIAALLFVVHSQRINS